MNRNQRRYKYRRPKINEGKSQKNELGVTAPGARRPMHSRCCYITPEQRSFAQLTNSYITETPSQYQDLSGSDPHRLPNPDLKQFEEPMKPKSPELITIASPKQPFLIDMPPKPRSNLRTLYGGKKHRPDVKSHITPESAVDCSNSPYVSNLDLNSSENCGSTLPLTLAQIEELRMILLPPSQKVEKASQYEKPLQYESSSENLLKWHNVDDADEIDNIILKGRDEETLTQYHNLPKNVRISEAPRVKLVAEKFNKYKKDNVEVRRLEEKVVCVEYDVFAEEGDDTTPVQRIRAFFSIKPGNDGEDKNLTELPSTIKNKFKVSAGDLQKLNQKEIEVLDGKILENQPYLDDLRKLLRRRENAQKNKNTLNLQALYEMGKRDLLDFDTNFDPNVMPKEELITMQNIILKNCKSSVHGIRRRTVEDHSHARENTVQNAMSRSLITELLRESNKTIAGI